MIKDGKKITTTLVGEEPTDEHNGLYVKVDISNSRKFIENLDQICYFPNVYVEGKDSFNSRTISKYKNYWANNIHRDYKILLGNVTYPIVSSHLNRKASDYLRYLGDSGIAFKFEIGELEVTPNREEIIYTEKTIGLINSRILAAKEEIESYIKQNTSINFTNLVDLANIIQCKRIDFSTMRLIRGPYNAPNITDIVQYTYNNEKLNISKFENFCYTSIHLNNYKAVHYSGKWHKELSNNQRWRIYFNNSIFIVVSGRLYQWQKDYIVENYKTDKIDYIFIIEDITCFGELYRDMVNKYAFIIKNYLIDHVIKPTIPKPDKTIRTVKKQKQQLLHLYNGYIWEDRADIEGVINKYKRQGIVILNREQQNKDLAYIINRYGYGVAWASKEVLPTLENYTCVMSLDKFLKKKARELYISKLFKYKNLSYFKRYIPNIDIPNKLVDCTWDIPKEYISEKDIKDGEFISKYFNAWKETRKNYFRDLSDTDVPDVSDTLLLWYIAAKQYNLRIRWEELNKMYNDKLIKACRK